MQSKPRRAFRFERLESRDMLAANIIEHADIGYFFAADSARVDRYDIAHEIWLSPIDLSGVSDGPSTAYVDNDGIYAAYGKAVYRFSLAGGQRTHLLNAQDDVIAIHSDGNLLFLNHTTGLYGRFISINKTSNTVIDTHEQYVDSVSGSSISPQNNRIFGRSVGVSPSDITYVGYDNSGFFTTGGDSRYHGDYPDASRVWVFSEGQKVVDDAGEIYATENLNLLNSLGTPIDDIDFRGDKLPIVLRGSTVTA